jgi:N12 class adenine-specific DNA methylase/uncharacterized membrane protein/predicted kinase
MAGLSFDDLPDAKPSDGLAFDHLPDAAPARAPQQQAAPAPQTAQQPQPSTQDVPWTDYPIELGKSAVEGSKNLPAGALKGMAAIGWSDSENRGIGSMIDRVQAGEDPADVMDKPNLPPAMPLTEHPLWKAGEAIENFGKEALGPRPGFEGRTWTRDIGGGFGSVAAGVVASMLNPIGAGLMFVTAGQGEAAENAVKAGATPEQVRLASSLGSIAGVTDVVDGLLPMFGSYGKALGFIKRVGYAAVAGALAEGGQEGLQQFIQNVIAQQIYDPNKDWLEDVPRSAAVGAIVGGAVSGGHSAIAGKEEVQQPKPGDVDTSDIDRMFLDEEAQRNGEPQRGGVSVKPYEGPTDISGRMRLTQPQAQAQSPDIEGALAELARQNKGLEGGDLDAALKALSQQDALGELARRDDQGEPPPPPGAAPALDFSDLPDALPRDYIITDPLGAKTDGEQGRVRVLRGKDGKIEAMSLDDGRFTDVAPAYRDMTPEEMIAHTFGGHAPDADADATKVAAAPVTPVAPAPSTPAEARGPRITYLAPDALQTDAARFQYKGNADQEGVTGALKDVKKWDDRLANPILAWEAEDGSLYVVNGHQRTDLAKRASAAGQPDVQIPARIMREADGFSPDYMRALGAFQNIAEGTGTAIDAAKVLRANQADLADVLPPLPPRSQLVQNAKALAELSDEAFGMVVNEVVPEAYAAQVGATLKNPAEQLAAMDVLAKAQPANVDQARIMVEDIKNAGFLKGSETSLFGEEEFAHSLVAERARILDRAVKTLRKLGSTFKTAVEQEGTLAEAGNKLKRAANEKAKTENERLAEVLANDGTRKGPISDALSDAARELAGGKPIGAVTPQFLSKVRSLAGGRPPRVQSSAPANSNGPAGKKAAGAVYSINPQQRAVAPETKWASAIGATPTQISTLKEKIERRAPAAEIEADHIVKRAKAYSEALPETAKRPGYGTPEYLANREYNFDGKIVRGTEEAVDRLEQVARAYAKGPVANERRAVIVTGPPASGKSFYAEKVAAAYKAAIVDSDDAKKVLPEFGVGLGANAVHEESGHLADDVLQRLVSAGGNVVLPKVGGKIETVRDVAAALKKAGYQVDLVNISVAPDEAYRRMISRFVKTGRLIGKAYFDGVGDKPDRNYYILKGEGNFNESTSIDGNGPVGGQIIVDGEGSQISALLGPDGGRGTRDRRSDTGDRLGDRVGEESPRQETAPDAPKNLYSVGRGRNTDRVDLAGGQKGDQFVLPGAEKEAQGKTAQRGADAPLTPKKPQKGADIGLFGDDAQQLGLGIEAPNDTRGTVRPGAPGVSGKQQAGSPKAVSTRRRPEPVSLFDWGGSREPVLDNTAPNEQGGKRKRPAVPQEGGSVTKPPAVGAGNRPRRDRVPAERGLDEARKKIAERSRLNYRITDADRIGEGGPKQKVRDNLEAIRVLRQLEEENRQPTPEEKAKLVKYVGWGAFAQDVFASHKPEWQQEREELRALLSDGEYADARASTLNAHFTSPDVVRGIWDVLDHLGYDGGLAIEPSAGIGHFIGLTPDHVAPKTAWTAVELDPTTGKIAKALYGGSEVNIQGYETLKRPSNYYDLAISNVPFGDYNITEKPYGKYPIHDFFFVKSLDKVRPGGVVAFVTSRYTMDRMDADTRREFARNADLVGAIRLPGGRKGAFAGNAGTEVTTDILFLRKRVPGEKPFNGAKWLETKQVETPDGPTNINEYFADHPEMMMGEMRLVGSMYSKNEPVLVGTAEGLRERIAEAARKNMEAGAFLPRGVQQQETLDSSDIDATLKDGALFVKDGKVYQRQNGQGVEQKMNADDIDRVSRLSDMRGMVNNLLAAQLGNTEVGSPADLRRTLNKAYDAFVKKWGPINLEISTETKRLNKEGEPVVIIKRPNFRPFEADPDAYKVASIEKYDSETGKASPAAIQTKNVIEPPTQRQINGPADALAASLDKYGEVDIGDIAESLDLSQEDAIARLGNSVFLNPNGRKWTTADDYLSGNVVQKLEEARSIAAEDSSYQRNVDALEKVQPAPIPASEITAQFGAPWVPEHVYESFIKEVLGGEGTVKKVPITGEFRASLSSATREARTKYATDRVGIEKILQAAINNQTITVRDTVDDKPVINHKDTEEARIKTEALKVAFAGDPSAGIDGWAWKDPARAAELGAIYNRTYNNLVPFKADGSHLTLPGLNRMFADRQHRLDAIWRMITKGNTLLAHVVGSGKTVTMIAGGMEMKRLGLINKPAYVVPNHMLEQFSREFIEAYPNAKILVAEKDEMTRDNRKAFLAKAAANDWDGVIITHDAFGRINMDRKFREDFIRDQLAELARVMQAEIKEGGRSSATVKNLEKAKKRLLDKLNKLLNEDRKDDGVTFEESGIDHLFVDEAHKFKNLAFVTRMQRVKGLAQNEAQRSEDLFLKIRYLDQKRPGRSAVFATGTPVSNTMAELWTMQRYLQLEKLREAGLDTFDAWASTFGRVATNMELAPDGRTLRDVSSFSQFVNIPELVSLYSEVADTKTADMLSLPRPEVVGPDGKKGIEIVKVPPSETEEQYIQNLVELAESLKGKKPEKGQPNMLSVVTLGRKVATDGRLVGLPANENGKIATASRNIYEIWKDGKEPGTVQMVFLDLGVPQSKSAPKKKAPTDDDVEIEGDVDPMFQKYSVDLYADLKGRLVAMGIPAKQIATIHEADNDQKKAKLFERVRAGDVRVLIGSSEKMGVGTNVQPRLIAMHHLDSPYRPADVEQRDGRIVRQGNLNPQVRILRYVTEKSFDAFMWQTLDRKAKFIGQVLSGAKGSRQAEDIDNPLPEAAEMKAAASGDPRILELAELDRVVRQLSSQRRVFEDSKAQAVATADMTKARIKFNEEALPDAEKAAAQVEDLSGDKFKVDLNGAAFTDRKEAGQRVLDAMLDRPANSYHTPKRVWIGDMSGFKMGIVVQSRYGDEKFYLTGTPILQHEGGKVYSATSDIAFNEHTDAPGIMRRFENILKNVALEPERIERVIQDEKAQLPGLEKMQTETWPKEAELQQAKAALKALTQELMAKPSKAAPVTRFQPDTPYTLQDGTMSPAALFDIRRDLSRLAQLDRAQLERQITAIVRRTVGDHANVSFENTIPLPEEAADAWGSAAQGVPTAAGVYVPADRLISIAMADPLYRRQSNTAYHESWHAVENMLLRDSEMAALKAAEPELRQIVAEFTGLAPDQVANLADFEVRAIAFEAYADKRGQGKSVGLMSGAVRNIFERLRQMFRRIRDALGMRGYTKASDIFSDVYEGRMAGREAVERPFVQEAASVTQGAPGPSLPQRRSLMQRMDMRPIDRALRLPFDVFGGTNQKGEWKPGLHLSKKAGDIITNAKFSDQGRFHWLNPTLERARAGLVDRYGLDPAYVERDRQRALDERGIMKQVPEIMQTMKEADVSSAEAVVMQKILTGEPISDAHLERLAEPVRQAIDQFGQEAVDLGLLSQESFDRNKGAYLHRVYRKHETGQNALTKWVGQMAASRRKKIIGNQFKGRGLWKEVSARSVNNAPKGSKLNIGGTAWEVRGYKSKDRAVLWRDYTPTERERMGEILDARYTIAKTYMVMAHDLATGRFYRDIAENQDWSSDLEPPQGTWKNAAEYARLWNDPSVEWVKVPGTKIASSNTFRYGQLADKWVRAEIWRDINELERMQNPGFWNSLLTQWKLNKTARSPVTHMNNVMSNALLMDMADVRARDLVSGIRSLVKGDALYQEAADNGAFGGDMISQEIRDNVLKPILEEIENRQQAQTPIGLVDKVLSGIFSKGALVGAAYGAAGGALVGGPVGAVAGAGVGAVTGALARKKVDAFDDKMLNAYRLEDEVFRMATYIRRVDQGLSPREAAIEANEQFLDYDIRAPWVNAARRTLLPFIAYTYRATPLVAKTVMTRPWKIAKYATAAFVLNGLGYAFFPGDEDEERKSLRKEEQGRTWIGAPRMLRMPWGDSQGNPVFLDIRRWIPAGDIFDTNQGQSAVPVPAPLQFGGPLMLGAELALNKQAFTGKEIVNTKTDDMWDKGAKLGDWAWKSWMPGAAWIPGSWYWEKVGDAAAGARDRSGRPYSLPGALSSSVGVKFKAQDVAEGRRQIKAEFDRVTRELDMQKSRLIKDRGRGLISEDRFKDDLAALGRKRQQAMEEQRRQRATD